ncbi:hypothetical protein BC332_23052 [Capsicum chinense]|nr:hypothetical protein BC332_23052 [Capsicum chinense]
MALNWAELPRDLIDLIAKHIKVIEDLIAFGAVGTSCRNSAIKGNFDFLSPQLPLSMLADKGDDYREFILFLRTKDSRVFLPEVELKKIHMLGDFTIFVGLNRAICIDSTKFTEVKFNHIYFVDRGGIDLGAYNLEDGNVESCYHGVSLSYLWSPTWVVFKNIESTEMELAKLEIPQKNVTKDERLVDFDDDFQDPSPKNINEHSKKKQKMDSSTPVAKKPIEKKQERSNADSHAKEVAVSKRESHIEKETFMSKKVFDAFREEGCTDLHPDKINIEIDSQHLISDELFQSINLNYNLSEEIVHHDVRIIDEKLNDTNLSYSQFTIPDDLLPSFNAYRRESITRHPLTTCEEEQSDEHSSYKKFKIYCSRSLSENKENIGSSSKPNMHKEVDLDTEEQIMTTPKIQELTTDEQRDGTVWPDSQDTILDDLLPNLNIYSSKSIIVHPSAHQATIQIRRVTLHDEIWFSCQDCGVYMVTYAECLSYGHKVLANEFDLNALRTRYAALLWDYGTRKQDANAHSDVETPLRPARESRITSVTEVFYV